jgi:hypothetical protein
MARRPGGAQRQKLESSALKLDRQSNNGVKCSAFMAVVFLLLTTIKQRGTGRTMANARS